MFSSLGMEKLFISNLIILYICSGSIRNQDIPYSMNTTSNFELGIGSSSNDKNSTTTSLKVHNYHLFLLI